MLDKKIVLPGTHRARAPEDTWALIEPLLPGYGVTRVADVTGLDCIGVPVFLAVRPASETLSVAQGKGHDPILAKLSAVMETLEQQHAEHPGNERRTALARDLDLQYDVANLNARVTADAFDLLVLDWYRGVGLRSGTPTWIPCDVVDLAFTSTRDWQPVPFDASSNGLASGNTHDEAVLHGLYEVIERDVVSTLKEHAPDHRVFLDPRSISSPFCQDTIRRLDDAGVQLELALVPNPYALPVAVACIWSQDYPAVCAGAGAHSDPAVAVSRALTEAVQTRLTEITGTRDDIPSEIDVFSSVCDEPRFTVTGLDWDLAVEGLGFQDTSLSSELATLARRVEAVSGHEPIVLDLSTRPDVFSVVKVVGPGLRTMLRNDIPRYSPRADEAAQSAPLASGAKDRG
ncbi:MULTISPECIES: YcaO-like family protein [Actinomycetes]|uniref:YcaO-like family protein n=1 Tax=Actinomycetes TaxID=1760 RepID=UPI0001B566D4|nr:MULTISPECIES: YcaO-like family protein [Actinomycetes]EFL12569.1 hypothetical protein SSMG_08240 [Streptomyces sp. AA4]